MSDAGSIKTNVLDNTGFVELLDHMASDLKVVNAARTSLRKHSDEMKPKDERLINHLMKNRHGSPFEHAYMTFRIKAPIFVARQWQRHRMASYSEQSGRWSEFDAEFYNPRWYFRLASWPGYALYRALLLCKVPKERARMVLPQNLYTLFWFTVNARGLMNFLSLRNEDHAQSEIREYAAALETFFSAVMPATHAAFVDNGRKAP